MLPNDVFIYLKLKLLWLLPCLSAGHSYFNRSEACTKLLTNEVSESFWLFEDDSVHSLTIKELFTDLKPYLRDNQFFSWHPAKHHGLRSRLSLFPWDLLLKTGKPKTSSFEPNDN